MSLLRATLITLLLVTALALAARDDADGDGDARAAAPATGSESHAKLNGTRRTELFCELRNAPKERRP